MGSLTARPRRNHQPLPQRPTISTKFGPPMPPSLTVASLTKITRQFLHTHQSLSRRLCRFLSPCSIYRPAHPRQYQSPDRRINAMLVFHVGSGVVQEKPRDINSHDILRNILDVGNRPQPGQVRRRLRRYLPNTTAC